jgi:hypothetical protein
LSLHTTENFGKILQRLHRPTNKSPNADSTKLPERVTEPASKHRKE